jgi:hypothetical protein
LSAYEFFHKGSEAVENEQQESIYFTQATLKSPASNPEEP